MTGIMMRIQRAVRRFRSDRKGVGAVEFALIAPVLIVLYMGSLEVSVAMSVNKKVARAASAIADLVTQDKEVDKAYLATMVDVGQSVITPFRTDGLKVRITGIAIDGSKTARVAWSWDEKKNRPYVVNSVTTIPSELAIANTFLVRTEVELDHRLLLVLPGAKDLDIKTLTMRKTYHLVPRLGTDVVCSNC